MFSTVKTVFILAVMRVADSDDTNSRLNFFDTDLFRYSAEDKSGNIVISPASIKSTLAMILEGARGDTAAEIRNALRLSPNKDDFREQLNIYLLSLQNNDNVTSLQNANAVFTSNKLKMKNEYEILINKVYLAKIFKTNFLEPVLACDQINSWIHNRTKGLISNVIEPEYISPSSKMFLINALYFKSSWQHSFNPRFTRSGCFYKKGICKKVAMMELNTDLKYAYVDNLRAHALELPYIGGRYSMVLLVPRDRDGLAALIRDLPYMSLTQIYQKLETDEVELSMPKFTVDYSDDVVKALKMMRIKSLFSPTSNLSDIFEGDSPQVDSIYHRVHLSVDEEGTVAAAATSAMVVPLMKNGVNLRIDRPFVFFIRDNKYGFTLFEGKIEEPESLETVKNDQRNISKTPVKNTQPTKSG